MKNFKTFLLLLLVIPFFISCEKDEPEISKECILLDGKFFDGILFYEVINSTDARVKFVDENHREEKIVIPHKIKFDENVFLVTEIDSYAFSGCSGLTSIEIPNSVTSIGDGAFSGCSGLTSIEIPNSVTSIGYRAFKNCSGLTSIEIPNSVTAIGGYVFSGCSGLTSVVWNVVCKDFDANPYLFENAAKITSFTFGESVKFIPSYLCINMSKLTSIEIPNSVTSIGNGAFSGCSGLTSIEIPNSVTSIGECWVFSDCSGLTSIVVEAGNPVYDSRENCNAIIETETNKLIAGCQNSFIPNSVTSIGFGAFDGCSGLTSIEIPNSVTSIGERAFSYCSGLTSVVWNAVIGHLHYKWYHPFEGSTENLTSFVFGDSVQYIPSYLCANMSKLTSIEIPNSVNSIGDGAFYDCSGLTSVTIGNSVISIGKSVFDCCYRIIEINCKPITPPNIDSNSFCYFNATMNVPKGALSNYKNHPIWGKFKNINEVNF